jgi:hypothetical protein
MCVLLLHHRVRTDFPVVLLANRDEAYDRPFDPPTVIDEERGIVAPRDRRAGGTWLGVNREGLVVAITNRIADPTAAAEATHHGARSRGLLVLDALRAHDAVSARDAALGSIARERYEPFQLLLVDREAAFHVEPRGATALESGAHILSNLHEIDELRVPRAGLPDPGETIDEAIARLEALARDDTPALPGGHRILKRTDTRGTVCSAVLAIPAAHHDPLVFRFADGPPDTAPFRDVELET